MKRSVSALIDHHPAAQVSSAGSHEDDPRWQLALGVVGGPHFVRSPLLSKFLLYVVRETIEGRQTEISEHQIGVSVFGRLPKYRTDEDNIVRNYARQLRKRLTEHFAAESADGMRIDIPIGGYVPRFIARGTEAGGSSADLSDYAPPHSVLDSVSASRPGAAKPFLVSDRAQRRSMTYWLWLGLYSIALVALTWLAVTGFRAPLRQAQSNDALWDVIFSKSRTTYVVPPDAGFNVLEDMTHTSLPLASYIKGSYLDLPPVPLDDHTDQESSHAAIYGFWQHEDCRLACTSSPIRSATRSPPLPT
jgi:hypothetical protein